MPQSSDIPMIFRYVFALSDYFKDNPLINAVFVGPADHSLPDWILGGCKEKFIKTDPRSIDIKQIPAPARESLLYPECFSSNDMGMVMTSRGCPFDCSFCSNRLLTGLKYQFRTVEHVREELEHIVKKYHVEYLDIADANFLAGCNNALRMAELFKTLGIPWGCDGHISAINEETLKKLTDCGCNNISFGIESGNQSRLDKLNKKITLEQIEKTSAILNKHKIKWKTFFMVGFPDDTLEQMEQTRKFALKIKPSYISLNSFVPLPGTEIYNSWRDLFASYDVSECNQLNPKANFIKNIDVRTYQEKFKSMLEDFDEYNKQANSVNRFQGK